MKLCCALVLLWCCSYSCSAVANSPYQLPRSFVTELTEPATGRVYPLYIQLPPSYAKEPNRLYPVVYLLDADYSFPLVAGASRFPMNSGAMQQFILVGLSYAKGSKGPESRVRDYTPSVDPSWKLQTGFAKAHQTFIKDRVFAYLENHYRVSKTDRTLVGHSLGALFAASVLWSEPALFSSYILASPSVWFHDEMILTSRARKPTQGIKVYLAVGELETPEFGEGQNMVAGAVKLKEKIEKLNSPLLELKFSVFAGASHSTSFPTAAIQGLDWIYSTKQNKQH